MSFYLKKFVSSDFLIAFFYFRMSFFQVLLFFLSRKTIHPTCLKKPTKTFIIIMDRQSEAIKSPELQKILMRLPDIKAETRKFNMDVILITENELTSHPIKKLQEFSTEGTETLGFINFVHEIYTLFIMDIFDHVTVPEHRILSRKEEEAVLKQLRIGRHQLPKANTKDGACIILGAEVGDILEISAFNENSGIERRYRLVV